MKNNDLRESIACVADLILTSLVTSAELRRDPRSVPLMDSTKSQEVSFEFSSMLTGKSTMAFLTSQSLRVLKSGYTGGGPRPRISALFWRRT